MKPLSLVQAVKNFLFLSPDIGNSMFHWEHFLFPTSLKLTKTINFLLEPIDCQNTSARLHLGLHEALVNAVKHGNAGDPSKFLRVRRIDTPNWLVWQIQDQGDGVPSRKRLGQLPLHIDSKNGRGLFIICQCFDDVRWSKKGNRLQLAYRKVKTNYGGSLDLLFSV